MRRQPMLLQMSIVIGVLTGAAGCQSVPVRILSFIGLSQKPLVILHVVEKPATEPRSLGQVLDPFAPSSLLRKALGKQVHREVVPELCFEFQLDPALRLGSAHLAFVSPVYYARMRDREEFRIVAVPVDQSGQAARPALLVVPRDADIQQVEQLRGKSVAFGPANHPRAHIAALKLLEAHGLRKQDLALEALPLPGSLRHIEQPRQILLAVMNGSADAGFVDAHGWDRVPETSDNPKIASRDKFRVLARTAAVPDELIIASPKLDETTYEAVREFLLTADAKHPDVLAPLGVKAFEPAGPDRVAAWMKVLESGGQAPASAPAGASEGAGDNTGG